MTLLKSTPFEAAAARLRAKLVCGHITDEQATAELQLLYASLLRGPEYERLGEILPRVLERFQ